LSIETAMPEPRRGPRAEPRGECYDKIRRCMESNLREYYQRHPERLMDERSMEKIAMIRTTLVCILEILDGYEITVTQEK
jgi:hypothetical protein